MLFRFYLCLVNSSELVGNFFIDTFIYRTRYKTLLREYQLLGWTMALQRRPTPVRAMTEQWRGLGSASFLTTLPAMSAPHSSPTQTEGGCLLPRLHSFPSQSVLKEKTSKYLIMLRWVLCWKRKMLSTLARFPTSGNDSQKLHRMGGVPGK